jgi:hypothetical protein
MYIMSAYYPPRENVPIFDASLFRTTNDGSGSSSQSVSSSGGNTTPQSITITPSPTFNLNDANTFSYIKNRFGSNSALSVPLVSQNSGTTYRQNLCEVFWGSNAFSSLNNATIQFRYTLNINDLNGTAYTWDKGGFFIAPDKLYFAGTSGSVLTFNSTQVSSTTGGDGFFMTDRITNNYQSPSANPYNNLVSIPILYIEYIVQSSLITLYVINDPANWSKTTPVPPAGKDIYVNFNIEILNNQGEILQAYSPPLSIPSYTTAMVVNINKI